MSVGELARGLVVSLVGYYGAGLLASLLVGSVIRGVADVEANAWVLWAPVLLPAVVGPAAAVLALPVREPTPRWAWLVAALAVPVVGAVVTTVRGAGAGAAVGPLAGGMMVHVLVAALAAVGVATLMRRRARSATGRPAPVDYLGGNR
ncbi:hypothetical protein [Xylanimonas oleitrophica]|uniref:hypothetical protein n=1 Tax=Xylanimonas oleitrophica TaxID=2607479 RepID=UPI0011B5DB56|nr:hypothetical protein [Xylanimonas oleitrophica]